MQPGREANHFGTVTAPLKLQAYLAWRLYQFHGLLFTSPVPVAAQSKALVRILSGSLIRLHLVSVVCYQVEVSKSG